MSEETNNSSPQSIGKLAWTLLFALFYPVLITFSLLFTGILLLFSGISKVIFKIVTLFGNQSEDKAASKTNTSVDHPPVQ